MITESLMLAIDDNRDALGECLECAQRCLRVAPDSQPVNDGLWTEEQAARYMLAADLRSYVERSIDRMPQGGTDDDDIRMALALSAAQVADWDMMARHYIGKVQEGASVPA